MITDFRQKALKYLVHSFLYYHVNETLISDIKYDQICLELKKLIDNYPNKDIPYYDLVKNSLNSELSGFNIKNYPPEIISTSLQLLYRKNYRNLKSFSRFIEILGYKLIKK